MNSLFEDDVPTWPTLKSVLYELGKRDVLGWCSANGLPLPEIRLIKKEDWVVNACAYYRPGIIRICLESCGRPCGDNDIRNWAWPGYVTDREPYGVLFHELGHHVDWEAGAKKGSYWSEFSKELRWFTQDKQLTSYCDNDAEWFAEIFRLFGTNPDLLRLLRPKTYRVLKEKYKPLFTESWINRLGYNAPARVVAQCRKKGAY